MSARSQRGMESVRSFNRLIAIGTEVIFREHTYKTWSPAGLGRRDVPSVFLEGIEVPVPIHLLTIPGYQIVYGRRAR